MLFFMVLIFRNYRSSVPSLRVPRSTFVNVGLQMIAFAPAGRNEEATFRCCPKANKKMKLS